MKSNINKLNSLSYLGLSSLILTSCSGGSKTESKNNVRESDLIAFSMSSEGHINNVKHNDLLPMSLSINCPKVNYKHDNLEINAPTKNSINSFQVPQNTECEIEISKFKLKDIEYTVAKNTKPYSISSFTNPDTKSKNKIKLAPQLVTTTYQSGDKSAHLIAYVKDTSSIHIVISDIAGQAENIATTNGFISTFEFLTTSIMKDIDLSKLELIIESRNLNNIKDYTLKGKADEDLWSKYCKVINNTNSKTFTSSINIDQVKNAYDLSNSKCSEFINLNYYTNWNNHIQNEMYFIFAQKDSDTNLDISKYSVIKIPSKIQLDLQLHAKYINDVNNTTISSLSHIEKLIKQLESSSKNSNEIIKNKNYLNDFISSNINPENTYKNLILEVEKYCAQAELKTYRKEVDPLLEKIGELKKNLKLLDDKIQEAQTTIDNS